MKNKGILLTLVFGALLATLGSCSNGKERSSGNGLEMDSASMAERAGDALVLSALKDKMVAAEQNAKEAIQNTREAKRIERESVDAADQAGKAYRTEQEAQRTRQRADEQATKAEHASDKSNKN